MSQYLVIIADCIWSENEATIYTSLICKLPLCLLHLVVNYFNIIQCSYCFCEYCDCSKFNNYAEALSDLEANVNEPGVHILNIPIYSDVWQDDIFLKLEATHIFQDLVFRNMVYYCHPVPLSGQHLRMRMK